MTKLPCKKVGVSMKKAGLALAHRPPDIHPPVRNSSTAGRRTRTICCYDERRLLDNPNANLALPAVQFSLPQQTAIMSDAGEIEVEQPQGYPVLPKEVASEIGSVKLFNKWSYEDVEIRDISLT